MVYLAGSWGMGETEPQCHSTTTSPVSTSFLQDHDEEVALHPLNNQVKYRLQHSLVLRTKKKKNNKQYSELYK